MTLTRAELEAALQASGAPPNAEVRLIDDDEREYDSNVEVVGVEFGRWPSNMTPIVFIAFRTKSEEIP